MIIRKKEYPHETIKQMKGGIGEFVIEHLVEKTLMGRAGRLFAKGILKPGYSVGWHIHERDMEICYILKGFATVYDDEKTPCRLEAGDTHVCLLGHGHSIINEGITELEYLAVVIDPGS